MKIRCTWSWRRNALRLYSHFYDHIYCFVFPDRSRPVPSTFYLVKP
ncbi:MAG TPA: hypothetical protein PK471_06310 [Bacteroidales bacterium]|nr:hypothetical protein [Bacteroidales bacterium]HQQ21505.1 hypothetical protein [Bacteroidales bacterium]